MVEVAANSIGVKQGVNAARCEISMLIEDFLKKKEQEQRVIEILENTLYSSSECRQTVKIKGVGILTVASFLGEVEILDALILQSRYKSLQGWQ